MATTNYEVTHDSLYWSCMVEIQDEVNGKSTIDWIKEMVDFWTGSSDRLEENDGDYTKTFLKQLASECFKIGLANNYNTHGIVEEFADKEGWVSMDGAYGIKILNTDDCNIPDDFSIKTLVS